MAFVVLNQAMRACLLRPFTMSAAALMVTLAVGCSKSPGKPTTQEARLSQELSIPANTPFTNLGVVELSLQAPNRVSLGKDRYCLLSPTVLADHELLINLTSEAKTSDGKILSTHSKITVHSGQQCVVPLDGQLVAFTPKLKVE